MDTIAVAHRFYKIIFALLLTTTSFCAMATGLSVFWQGQITELGTVRDGVLPAGLSVGDDISGTIRFLPNQYESSNVLSNGVSSTFAHGSSYRHSITAGNWRWDIKGGEVVHQYHFPTHSSGGGATGLSCTGDG